MPQARQRGAALLALLAVVALGASWFLVPAERGKQPDRRRRKYRNAEVLNRAKQALIGYVAAQAAVLGEEQSGRSALPGGTPGYFDTSGPRKAQTAVHCTLPTVGRFPWRTIGTDKLVDAAGEPLWYVVSPGWAVKSTGVSTTASTRTRIGQLTVDGAANTAVALIIAPGPAFSVPPLRRDAPRSPGPPDHRARRTGATTSSAKTRPTRRRRDFVTTGRDGSFNDQVMRVTVADLMPGIEAAIAKRIEREIVPALKTVYVTGDLGNHRAQPAVSLSRRRSRSPGPGAGTSDYVGAAGTTRVCCPSIRSKAALVGRDPRCTLPRLRRKRRRVDSRDRRLG